MADLTTDPAGRSPEEIRRDIDRKRDNMDRVVEVLEDRLTPQNLVDEVWRRVKGPEDSVAHRVTDLLRDHPMPMAFMGLGLGWLAMEQASGRSRGPRRAYSAQPHGGFDGEDGSMLEEARGKVGDVTSRVGDKLGDASSKLGDARAKMGELGHTAGDKLEDARHTMKEGVSTARDGVHRARRTLQETMDENPMMLGAVAFGVGLVGGVAIPSSRTEDRALGHASEQVKDEARRIGSETAESARKVAEDAAGAAREAAAERAEKESLPFPGGPASEGSSGSQAQPQSRPESPSRSEARPESQVRPESRSRPEGQARPQSPPGSIGEHGDGLMRD